MRAPPQHRCPSLQRRALHAAQRPRGPATLPRTRLSGTAPRPPRILTHLCLLPPASSPTSHPSHALAPPRQALNSNEHASLLLGVNVLAVSSAPARVALILPTPPTPPSPPPAPAPLDVGLVVGGVLGGACFVGLLAGLYYAWRWYERRLEIAMGIQPKPKPPPKPKAPHRGPSKAKAVRRKLRGKSPFAARFGSRCTPTALARADAGSRPGALFKAPESLRRGGGGAAKAPRGDKPATKTSRGAAGSSSKNASGARRSEKYQDRVPGTVPEAVPGTVP